MNFLTAKITTVVWNIWKIYGRQFPLKYFSRSHGKQRNQFQRRNCANAFKISVIIFIFIFTISIKCFIWTSKFGFDIWCCYNRNDLLWQVFNQCKQSRTKSLFACYSDLGCFIFTHPTPVTSCQSLDFVAKDGGLVSHYYPLSFSCGDWLFNQLVLIQQIWLSSR